MYLGLAAGSRLKRKRGELDLSLEWVEDAMYNANQGADQLREHAQGTYHIEGFVAIQEGRVMAEYYRTGVEQTDLHQLWSCTKTWVSLLVGNLVLNNQLELNMTLADIWPPSHAMWQNVTSADEKQLITLESLLTMTSGLTDPQNWLYSDDEDGGNSLLEALNHPTFQQSKVSAFNYLSVSAIMAYVIKEITGLNPQDFALREIFPALGLQSGSFSWWANNEGVQHAYHGLVMSPRQMAKLGMLFLQNGLASGTTRLVSADWVEASTHKQVSVGWENMMYGYLWWLDMFDGTYCAVGFGGQYICVCPSLDLVFAITSNWQYMDDTPGAALAQLTLEAAAKFSIKSDPNGMASNSDNSSRSTRRATPLLLLASLLLKLLP